MKISIYPEANFLPKNSQDKVQLAHLSSSPNLPEVVEIADEDALMQVVTKYSWSPSIFSGTRHNDNFVSADFMGFDVDSGLSMAEAEVRVQKLGLACLCLPSPSYSPDKEKFRLIFPLVKTIYSKEVFDETWDWLQQQFPELDPKCSDYARFYCLSRTDVGFWQEGEFLEPKIPKEKPKYDERLREVQIEVTDDIKETVKNIYGFEKETVPESVSFFLQNAATGISGAWIDSLNKFCFVLSLSGIDGTIIESVVEQLAPEPLTKRDVYQINRSIKDGERVRSESR